MQPLLANPPALSSPDSAESDSRGVGGSRGGKSVEVRPSR